MKSAAQCPSMAAAALLRQHSLLIRFERYISRQTQCRSKTAVNLRMARYLDGKLEAYKYSRSAMLLHIQKHQQTYTYIHPTLPILLLGVPHYDKTPHNTYTHIYIYIHIRHDSPHQAQHLAYPEVPPPLSRVVPHPWASRGLPKLLRRIPQPTEKQASRQHRWSIPPKAQSMPKSPQIRP